MKISELIALLEQRKRDYGDMDTAYMQQTGPDSFCLVKITEAFFGKEGHNTAYLVLE